MKWVHTQPEMGNAEEKEEVFEDSNTDEQYQRALL